MALIRYYRSATTPIRFNPKKEDGTAQDLSAATNARVVIGTDPTNNVYLFDKSNTDPQVTLDTVNDRVDVAFTQADSDKLTVGRLYMQLWITISGKNNPSNDILIFDVRDGIGEPGT